MCLTGITSDSNDFYDAHYFSYEPGYIPVVDLPLRRTLVLNIFAQQFRNLSHLTSLTQIKTKFFYRGLCNLSHYRIFLTNQLT